MANNHSNYTEHTEQSSQQHYYNQGNQYMQHYYYYNYPIGYNGIQFQVYQPTNDRSHHLKDNVPQFKFDSSDLVSYPGDKDANAQFKSLFNELSGVTQKSVAHNDAKQEKQISNEFLVAIESQKGPDSFKSSNVQPYSKTVKETGSNVSLTSEATSPDKDVDFKTVLTGKLQTNDPNSVVKFSNKVGIKENSTPGLLVKRSSTDESSERDSLKYGYYHNGCVCYSREDVKAISYKDEDFVATIDVISKLLVQLKAKPVIKKGEGAWRGISEKLDEGLSVTNEAKYSYMIMSILNKISLQSFHKLFNEFSKIDIYSNKKLEEFITVLFKKATRESSFCYLYAEFVKRTFTLFDKLEQKGKDLAEFLKQKIVYLVDENIKRSKEEEDKINELKLFKSNDEDKVDEVLSELVEMEKLYKKPKLGVLQFVSELYNVGIVDNDLINHVFKTLKGYTDSFGYEMLTKLIQYSGDLIYSKEDFKDIIDSELTRLEKISSKLPFEIRFAIVDTIKMKSEGFKNVKRNSVPAVGDTPKNAFTNKQRAINYLDKKKKPKTPVSTDRRGRGSSVLTKAQNKFSNLSNSRFVREPDFVPPEKPEVVAKPSYAKAWSSSVAAAAAAPTIDRISPEIAATEKKLDLEVIVPDMFMAEFDIDEAFLDARDYQMNKYALDFSKIGLKVILENKRMHLSFGLLLVRLISSFPEFKKSLPGAIAHVMEELPMNALDEPILWTRFYLVLIPLLSADCIKLDEVLKIMSGNDEIEDPLSNVVDLFNLCKKDVTTLRLLKIMNLNKDGDTFKKVLEREPAFNEIKNTLLSNEKNNLLSNFFNTSIDNAQISKEIKSMYPDEYQALLDIAREAYLNCLIGKEFNSGLTNILCTRKGLFTELFKNDGSNVFLKCFMDYVIKFDSKFELLSNIGLAMCKAEYLDIDWLQKLSSTFKNEDIQERILIQVTNIANQLKK